MLKIRVADIGMRHLLADVLLMCIMAMMSGYQSYREVGRFVKRNQKEYQQSLQLLHKVPSYVTIRDVLQRIDLDKFAFAFDQRALQYVPLYKDVTKALDRKAIAGMVVNGHDSYRNFMSLVSVFADERGIVLCCDKIDNRKESEMPAVRQLIEVLDVEIEIFTFGRPSLSKKR